MQPKGRWPYVLLGELGLGLQFGPTELSGRGFKYPPGPPYYY